MPGAAKAGCSSEPGRAPLPAALRLLHLPEQLSGLSLSPKPDLAGPALSLDVLGLARIDRHACTAPSLFRVPLLREPLCLRDLRWCQRPGHAVAVFTRIGLALGSGKV